MSFLGRPEERGDRKGLVWNPSCEWELMGRDDQETVL